MEIKRLTCKLGYFLLKTLIQIFVYYEIYGVAIVNVNLELFSQENIFLDSVKMLENIHFL